jgi:membrane protein DedA with SNARE-associated domain
VNSRSPDPGTRGGPRTLAAVTHFFTSHGLPLLFAVVMLESFGLPLPGETALIAFAVLAAQGHYDIAWVIGIAAAAAIVGDNLGYWLLGRLGGRALFERWGWLRRYSERVLPVSERLMGRHGGKTVFFGRFITVLRYTAAWVAGLGRMPWWRFLFWNAVGGICWATLVGLLAYFAGTAAADAVQRYGLFAGAGLVALFVIVLLALRLGRHRLEERI